MRTRGHNVIFVCPTNVLAEKYKEHGCTLNKFLGIGLTEETKIARFDDTNYDTVVFDEIFFYSIRRLARIKKYCDDNPEKIIIATGDTKQLKAIDVISNQLDYDTYADYCVDSIFANRMMFNENKRLKKKKDKMLLKQFKTEIFDETIPVESTIKKFFKTTPLIDSEHNICYKNSTAKIVAKTVRSKLGRFDEYEVGERLICRNYFTINGKFTFHVNYEYKIKKVQTESLTFENDICVSLKDIRSNFIHGYCKTAHSYQGSTVDKPITIFDWKFRHVDRRWIYTAVTRTTKLDNVSFYQYIEKSDKEEDKILNDYLDLKVRRYRVQDEKGNREIDERNYVSRDWLKNAFGSCCGNCGDNLIYSIENGKIESNLSAQRIDNEVAHMIDNIIPFCVYCNCSLSNRD